jgi:hypothetical protein
MMHLQTLSPAQPMPEESELDAKFTELLVIVFFLYFLFFFSVAKCFWLIISRNGFHRIFVFLL